MEQLEHWFHTTKDEIEIIKNKIMDDISHITGIGRET